MDDEITLPPHAANGDGPPHDATHAAMEPASEKARNSTIGLTLNDTSKSLLRKWLTRSDDNPDPSRMRRFRWRQMGWEVFERKSLLLASAADLVANGVPNASKLAATDIFVEKAQRYLTFRGRVLYFLGFVTATLTILVLAAAAWFVHDINVADLLMVGADSSKKVSNAYLTVLLLKSTTAGGLVFGIAYFLASLTRALLHEATVLYSRRHSLRFGRLFVYLMSDKLTRKDLESIFNWNAEFSTAFRDIKAENVGKSPAMRVVETPGELLKSLTEMVKLLNTNSEAKRHRRSEADS